MNKMCTYNGTSEMIDEPKDAPKFVRCPECGRRLKPRLSDCHWPGPGEPCWHWNIPPHKVKGWWKKHKKISRSHPNLRRKYGNT